MKNRILALTALLGASCGSLFATVTELRTPLMVVQDFGPSHYRLGPVDEDACWSFDTFFALYARRADRGFGNVCGTTRCTSSLSTLFFGADQFAVIQSFAGGMGSVPGNIFVNISTITPSFHYTEKGLAAGFHVESDMGCGWRAGARGVLPFNMSRIDLDLDCQPLENAAAPVLEVQQRVDPQIPVPAGTTLVPAGVSAGTNVVLNPLTTTAAVYAYRLDLLTALQRLGLNQSLVNYANPNFSNDITINSVDITNVTTKSNQTIPPTTFTNPAGVFSFTLGFPQNATRSVYAVRSTDGTITSILPALTGNYTEPQGAITAFAPDEWSIARDVAPDASVNADGSGGVNGNRLAFNTGTNYSALGANPAAQRQLYIIPNSNGFGQLLPIASQIKQAVDNIIALEVTTLGTNPALLFLQQNCIDLCSANRRRFNGLGDFDTDIYIAYDREDMCGCGDASAELYLGVRWPTGRRVCNPGYVFQIPSGNNGHYEIKGELDLYWRPFDWLGIHTYVAGYYALPRVELKAASFLGATIKNIGPAVSARVSWAHVVYHLDATFFSPCFCDLGVMVGYELYAKGRDKVCFCNATALDFNGTPQLLDPNILQFGTNAFSNKIRGEVFHRWDCIDLFVNASQVVSGRNIFKETEANLGVQIWW